MRNTERVALGTPYDGRAVGVYVDSDGAVWVIVEFDPGERALRDLLPGGGE